MTKRISYLGFGLAETHVVELEKYLILWVEDNMGTEDVAAAKAKAAQEADKPNDMTTKGRHKQKHRNP
ncbi:MAG: hypothetical protein ACKPKO_11675 [Candidatus Fonsibacter sp.]